MISEAYLWVVVLTIPLAALVWSSFEHTFRAWRVPRSEIRARAARLRALHGKHAITIAEREEASAYARGDASEQGIWRRVVVKLRREPG